MLLSFLHLIDFSFFLSTEQQNMIAEVWKLVCPWELPGMDPRQLYN